MSKILEKDIYFGLNYRNSGRSRFNIRDEKTNNILIPSFNALSTGQSTLFNMFATIVRYADDNSINNSIALSQIKGVVVIDEIELHLHSNLQRNTLPRLMQLFPKVQFIVTTHSPLFLLGMDEVYGKEGYEIYEMPDGSYISSEDFSEFQRAYIFLTETQKHKTEIKNAINTYNAHNKIPLIITEGSTDWKHMKAAFVNLSRKPEYAENYRGLNFEFLEYEPTQSEKEDALKIQMSNTELTDMCKYFSKISQPRKLIFIADADDKITNKELGSNSGYKKWGNNVFSFIIPIPEHRANTPEISIEHYYSDDEIKTPVTIAGIKRRLYLGNEFNLSGVSLDRTYYCCNRNSCGPEKIRIIDGSSKERVFEVQDTNEVNIALSKMDFANRILKNDPEFSYINFSSFSLIFDIIKQICDDNCED